MIRILCFRFYCSLKAVPVKVARKLLLCWPTLQWPLIKVFSNDGPRRHLARFFHLKQTNSNLSDLQNFPLTWDASAHLNISESTFSDIGGLISVFRDIPLSYQLKQSHCAAEMAFISFGSCCAFIGARVVNLRENTFMIADPRTNWWLSNIWEISPVAAGILCLQFSLLDRRSTVYISTEGLRCWFRTEFLEKERRLGLGKPLFEMCCFHMSIARIALDPPLPPLSNGHRAALFLDPFFHLFFVKMS